MSIIHNAIGSHDLAAVSQALQAEPGQLNLANDLGETPLHRAVWEALPDVVQLLLDAGAMVNAEGPSGDLPLHYAANEDRPPDIAELLIYNGAELNRKNQAGQTPLFIAAMRGNEEVASALINHGALVDLDIAILLGDSKRFEELLREDPQLRSLSKSELVLDLALRRGQKAIIERLLQHGLNPNTGRPPILTAIEMALNDPTYDVGVIRLLIDHGVDVRQPSIKSQILDMIRQFKDAGRHRVVNLLMQYGLNE